jgi:hypothetical protein
MVARLAHIVWLQFFVSALDSYSFSKELGRDAEFSYPACIMTF